MKFWSGGDEGKGSWTEAELGTVKMREREWVGGPKKHLELNHLEIAEIHTHNIWTTKENPKVNRNSYKWIV